jgi:hypothetical protein
MDQGDHNLQIGSNSQQVPVAIWGQSIGARVITNLAAGESSSGGLPLKTLVLETPVLSVRAMLETLYPQK